MSRRSPAVRWTAYVGVAIVFAILCAFLSNWQFARNAWRTDQLALVDRNYDAAPVPIADVLPIGGGFTPATEWKPVALEGRYLTEDQLLARNRPHGGTSAYEVLVPFLLDDGRILIVDRGWIPPSDEQHAEPEAVPAAPEGTATVVVRLRPGEALPATRSAPDGQVPTIHLPLIAEVIGGSAPVITDVYGTMASEDPAPSSVPNALDAPSIDPGPYLSYAIQWILFAIMGFVFIGYVIRTELRARKEDAEAGEIRRARRRRDRDTVDEDALIDAAR